MVDIGSKARAPIRATIYAYGSIRAIVHDASTRAVIYVSTLENYLGHEFGSTMHLMALTAVSGLAVTTSLAAKAGSFGQPKSDVPSIQIVPPNCSTPNSIDSDPYFDSLESNGVEENDAKHSLKDDQDQQIDRLQSRLDSALEEIRHLNYLLAEMKDRLDEAEETSVDLESSKELDFRQRTMIQLDTSTALDELIDHDGGVLTSFTHANDKEPLDSVFAMRDADINSTSEYHKNELAETQSSVDEYLLKLQETQSDLAYHQKQLAASQETSQSYKLHLAETKKELAETQGTLDEYILKLQEKESDLEYHQKELAISQEISQDYKLQLAETQGSLEHHKSELTRLQCSLKTHKTELAEAQNNFALYKNSHAEEQSRVLRDINELAEVQNDLLQYKIELEKAQSMLVQHTEELAEKDKNLLQHKNELGQTQRQLDDYKDELTRSRSRLNDCENELANVQVNLDESKNELARFQDLEIMKSNRLLDQVKAYQSEIEFLKNELHKAINESEAKVGQSLEQLRSQVARTEAAEIKLEHTESAKLRKVAAIAKTSDEYEILNRDLRAEVADLKKQLQTSNDSLAQRSMAHEQAVRSLESSTTKRIQEQVTIHQELIAQKDNAQGNLESEIADLLGQCQYLKSEDRKRGSEIDDYKQLIDGLRAKNSSLEAKCAEALKQKHIASQEIQAQASLLEGDLLRAKDNHEKLQTQHAKHITELQMATDERLAKTIAQHKLALSEGQATLEELKSSQESELRDLKGRYSTNIDLMKESMEKLQAEMSELVANHAAVVSENTQLAARHTALESEKTHLASEVTFLKAELNHSAALSSTPIEATPEVVEVGMNQIRPKSLQQESTTLEKFTTLDSQLGRPVHTPDLGLSILASGSSSTIVPGTLILSKNFSRRQTSTSQIPQPEEPEYVAAESFLSRSPPRRRSNSSAAKVFALTGDRAASEPSSSSVPPSPSIPQRPHVKREKSFKALFRRTSEKIKRHSSSSHA